MSNHQGPTGSLDETLAAVEAQRSKRYMLGLKLPPRTTTEPADDATRAIRSEHAQRRGLQVRSSVIQTLRDARRTT